MTISPKLPKKRGGRVRVDRVYPHSRTKVWRALTEPELLARWLMPNDFRAEVGHRFEFRTEPGPGFDGIVRCEVLELDEPRRMVWSWAGGPIDTVVTFTLEPVPGSASTRLVVVHEGFRGVQARLVQMIFRIGNRTMYGKRLPRLLDELDADGSRRGPAGESACMSPWQRVLVVLARLVPGKRARPRSPSS